MERLTYDYCVGDIHCWQVKGADNRECRQVCEEQGKNGCKGCPIALAFDRLAAYEDTGLVPETVSKIRDIVLDISGNLDRLRELAQADRDGRCVVLPCEVGDRVWFTKFMWNYAKQPIPAMVCGIKTFSSSGTFTFMALTDTNNVIRSFINQDIGKTVFLTQEEAEAALKERENKAAQKIVQEAMKND